MSCPYFRILLELFDSKGEEYYSFRDNQFVFEDLWIFNATYLYKKKALGENFYYCL